MVGKKESLKYVGGNLRQLIFRHLSSYAVLNDGRQYIHLLSAINLLRTAVGETIIKEKYKGAEYIEINNILIEFDKRANYISAFMMVVHTKDYRGTSFYNKAFRDYYMALQHIPLIHYKVTQFLTFLINKTGLKDMTIPSSYMAQANHDVISFETDEDKRRFSLGRSRRDINNLYDEQEEDVNETS